MKKILLGLVLLTSSLMATTYTQNKTMTMGWTAFKTPAKKGVNGSFSTIAFAAPKVSTSIEQLLLQSSVIIDTKSVNSKHEARDAKLVTFFFSLLNQETISARIIKVLNKKLTLEVTFNGITKHVEMDFIYNNKSIKATGSMDLRVFKALDALASINKACFDLHAGKTWEDVTIWFSLPVDES